MLMVLSRTEDRPVAGRLSAWCVGALAAAVLSLGGASSPAAGADNPLDDYKFALGVYEDGRWDLAAESFRSFLKQNPDHAKAASARLYLGLALVNLENYRKAREILREFVEKHPQNRNRPDALYRVGECSYLLDDLAAAEKELQAFLEKAPKHELAEWALPYLADTQLRLHKPKAAAETFRRALERFPEGRLVQDCKFGLARAYAALERIEAAAKLYRELAEDRTGSRGAQALLSLGTLYFDAGEYRKAADAYGRIPEAFPDSDLVAAAHLNTGYALYQLGDHQPALDRFQQAARDGTQRTTATYWQGVTYKALGDYSQAATALKRAFEADPEAPLARQALYQWADCELRNGAYGTAERLFLDFLKRWPESQLADDSLHFAAEAALLDGRLDRADELLKRFGNTYPDSDLWAYHTLLQGRRLIAAGDETALNKAAEQFRSVLQTSGIPRTQNLARYHLARALQQLGQHEEVVKTLAPLVSNLGRDGEGDRRSPVPESLILRGKSLLALDRPDQAAGTMTQYLELVPQGEQVDQALATRARAEARRGRRSQAEADLKALSERAAGSPLLAETIHQLAERAYEQENWAWAGQLFAKLSETDAGESYRARGHSGFGWSLFEQKKFERAAEAFGRVLDLAPDDAALKAEAAYMHARSLQKAGRLTEAAEAHTRAFQMAAPPADAPPASKPSGPYRYAFLAGLQAARIYGELGRLDQADAAYRKLFSRFPEPERIDELLDEWALLHYNAGRYERADELFRRLIDEAPESELADNARYTLAESQLIAGETDSARSAFRALSKDPQADRTVKENVLYRLIELAAAERQWKKTARMAEEFRKKFPDSEHRWPVQLNQAEAQLFLDQLDSAREHLTDLRANAPESVQNADWYPRVAILLAETHYRQKDYAAAVKVIDALRRRSPRAKLLYQADEILGRCYKNQAQFEKARSAFRRVVEDEHGRRTETAAKAQFLLAETHMLEQDYQDAEREYLKVYHLYDFPEWQAPALFQAAVCAEELGQWSNAVQAYENLLADFPESEFAGKAEPKLKAARAKADGKRVTGGGG